MPIDDPRAPKEDDTEGQDDCDLGFPPPDDPIQRFRERLRKLLRQVKEELQRDLWPHFVNAVLFLPAGFYYWIVWAARERILRTLRIGALVVLLFQFVLLCTEIAAHIGGHRRIIGYIEGLIEAHPTFVLSLDAAWAAAALVILINFGVEFRQRNHGLTLSQRFWALLVGRKIRDSVAAYKRFALPEVYAAFKDYGVYRICLWFPNAENTRLTVGERDFYPRDAPPTLTSLQEGEGVAWKVYASRSSRSFRYVPRFGFPFNSGLLGKKSLWFRHTLAFDIAPSSAGVGKGANQLPTAGRPRLYKDEVILEDAWYDKPTRSFVAAPIIGHGTCLGVLCVDFARTNPIGTDGIRIAMCLAAILGEEIAGRSTVA